MTASCRHCGVAGCETAFHRCLAADFSDPAYGAVHHLVVPTYGLQHNWYPREFAADLLAFVSEHLHHAPSDHARQLIRRATDGPVQVRTGGQAPLGARWERTVLDVDHSDPTTYAATVRAWTKSVVAAVEAAVGPADGG